MDKVSIVVPVFNMRDKIETCVKSLLNQTYSNIEIILIDDGSKDDSLLHCQNLEKKDKRVTVYHTENRGSGPARNVGIEQATGEYIYFPDADDFLEPDAISIMVEAIDNGRFDLVVFGYKNVNQNNELVQEKTYEESIQNGSEIRKSYKDYMTTMSKWAIQGAPWNKFFKLSIIRTHEIYFPPLRRHQDEGFIGRYMCWVKAVHFIEPVLYTYFINDLQKEWAKYPVDYIEAVIGLSKVRKETIFTWNDNDVDTHDLITKEYICNCIKGMELVFSPKAALKTAKERKISICQIVDKTRISTFYIPKKFRMKYQELVLYLIRLNAIGCLYFILKAKIQIEMHFKEIIKKIQYSK